MKNTLQALIEADTSFGIGASLIHENMSTFKDIPKATDDQKRAVGVTVEKVTVNQHGDEYLIEFNDNIEKFIKDQQICTVTEAVEEILEHYKLDKDDVSIIVDEETMQKIDVSELTDNYNVLRK